MARNKRKTVKDKEKLKKIRKEARKRWRKKKATEKAMQKLHKESVTRKPYEKGRGSVAELSPQRNNCKSAEPNVRQVVVQQHIKEIDPVLIVRTEKFLGSGTFGSCYLAYYRDIVVAVKEFKSKKVSLDSVKKEVRHEAKMINHLEDHRGVPLLFGVVTKSEPLRLITKFHGQKDKSLTLYSAIKKHKLEKPSWLGILKNLIAALEHVHSGGILHNDLKSNNVVMEKREKDWNPVIIDFGKARFAADPKPVMSLSVTKQEEYRKRYPHIAPEIVNGSGRQSFSSDIFSLGQIVLAVLNLLPTATGRSIKVARTAICDDPNKRPLLNQLFAVL